MKIHQLIIDIVKVTILPEVQGYTIEINGRKYESGNDFENRETMLEELNEDIAIRAADHMSEAEHENFLSLLHQVDWDNYL